MEVSIAFLEYFVAKVKLYCITLGSPIDVDLTKRERLEDGFNNKKKEDNSFEISIDFRYFECSYVSQKILKMIRISLGITEHGLQIVLPPHSPDLVLSDRNYFQLNSHVNKQNCHYWSTTNSQRNPFIRNWP